VINAMIVNPGLLINWRKANLIGRAMVPILDDLDCFSQISIRSGFHRSQNANRWTRHEGGGVEHMRQECG
jgi:hypothetical protein